MNQWFPTTIEDMKGIMPRPEVCYLCGEIATHTAYDGDNDNIKVKVCSKCKREE